ncbi:MAG TPA: hypothetical protein VGL24_04875 [Chthoniobacterales bacterium]|jgi:hypothetical protein
MNGEPGDQGPAAGGPGPRRNWQVLDDKRAAIIDVLEYLKTQPQEVRDRVVTDDVFARSLFDNPTIGNISVPTTAKTIFFAAGERALKEAGSIVLEVPRSGVTAAGEDLLIYVLGNYKYW